jgi:NADPH:quinone reductase-like Zn-dependent oxidoreductase
VLISLNIPGSVGELLMQIIQLAAATLLPRFLGGTPRHFKPSLIKITGDTIEKVGKLVDEKHLKPVLDSVWNFDDEGIKGAYTKIKSGRSRGKVVIKIIE